MSRLRLMVTDHELEVVQDPLLSSGSRNYDEVEFVFADNTWNSFGTKNGVFNVKGEKEAYPMLLSSNVCKIPTQVMVTDGIMYIGLHGVNSNGTQTKTTELVKIRIERGTFSEWSSVTPPTPSIYEQIMTELGTKVAYSDIMQTTGSETQKVMSQKAVTDAISEISSTGIVFRGSCLFSELPASASTGDEWYVTDRERMYVWNGTQWNPTSEDYKSRIEEEANARMSGDNDLQSQIVNVNKDVETLDAIVGGASEIPHTDPADGGSLLAQSRLIHHANLLPTGKFGRVGARSVKFNQMISELDSQYWVALNNTTVTFADNSVKFTTAQAYGGVKTNVQNKIKVKSGHKYYFAFKSNKNTSIQVSSNDGTIGITESTATIVQIGSKYYWNSIATAPTNEESSLYIWDRRNSGWDEIEVSDLIVCDLTAMNMESLSADQFRSLFPASYYPYNAGTIYDLNPSGFRIRGINLWDEHWKMGRIIAGQEVSDGTYRLISSDFSECKPSTEYYILVGTVPSSGMTIYQYDINQNYIGYIDKDPASGHTFTTNPNTHFIKIQMYAVYGTAASDVYKNDIQICENSLPDAIKTTYHPYEGHTVETPQIADGHYVNENCYDYVENIVEDGIVKGKKHTIVGSYTFTGNETYSQLGDNPLWSFGLTAKGVSSNDQKGNIICSALDVSTVSAIIADSTLDAISVAQSGTVFISTVAYNNRANLVGKTIYFELATETITDVEPLRSFDISDYSTVEPITPQDELVNRIDVPFSVLTKSNNGIIQQITTNKENIEAEAVKRSAQISNHEKRLRNLEHKSGDYETISYPDTEYGTGEVPSGVMEYAQGKVLRGVSRIKNNILDTSYFSTQTVNGVTATKNADGSWTINGTATADSTANNVIKLGRVNRTVGHTYLYKGIKGASASCLIFMYGADNTRVTNEVGAIYAYTTADANTSVMLWCANGTVFNNVIYYPIVTDLTQYFANDPIVDVSTLTIADIQQKYPWLLEPSEYGTRTVDSVYSGFRSKSRNLLNPSDVVKGKKISTTGTIVDNGGSYVIINVNPNTTYNLNDNHSTKLSTMVVYYDADMGFIFRTGNVADANKTIVTQSNCKYVGITCWDSASYFDDNVCFNKSDSQDGTFTEYFEDTLTLPTPVELRSAGSVSDTDELNVEVEVDGQKVRKRRQTQRVRTYTFTGEEYLNIGSDYYIKSDACDVYVLLNDLDLYITVGNGISNMLIPSNSSIWQAVGYPNTFKFNTNQLHINIANSLLGITDYTQETVETVKAKMASYLANLYNNGNPLVVLYKSSTESVTLLDPIDDNLLKVEPNGTVEAEQTNEPKVDSKFDVGYMYA